VVVVKNRGAYNGGSGIGSIAVVAVILVTVGDCGAQSCIKMMRYLYVEMRE